MKLAIGLIAVLLLTGCGEQSPFCERKYDMEKHNKAFLQCMGAVKDNPNSTHYNDQAEIVSECIRFGYIQSGSKDHCVEQSE
jgi:hypothetical protein